MRIFKVVLAVVISIGAAVYAGAAAAGATPVSKPRPVLTIHVGKSAFSDSGGATDVHATAHGLTDCEWTSAPKLRGFDAKVKCATEMTRIAHVASTVIAKTYVLEMKALHGTRSVVVNIAIREAAPVTATAQTTTTVVTGTPTPPVNVSKSVTYGARVDPSFTQNPTNPLDVTYDYSADATQTVGTVQTDLAAVGLLPSGILNLYNNGLLVCSAAVGGAVTDALCGVDYAAPGQYTLVTTYQSGSTSATETDTENITINPITTTILTVSGILAQGATQSTLNAVFATAYGPLVGATVAFSIGGATFTPPPGNVSCTVNWSGSVVIVPPWSSYVPGAGWVTYGQFGTHPTGAILDVTNNPFYYQLATSPNCTEVGDAKVPNMISVNSDGTTIYSVIGNPNNALYQTSSDSLAS